MQCICVCDRQTADSPLRGMLGRTTEAATRHARTTEAATRHAQTTEAATRHVSHYCRGAATRHQVSLDT
jgi:hypothetical protein